jgi:hypothetical protein
MKYLNNPFAIENKREMYQTKINYPFQAIFFVLSGTDKGVVTAFTETISHAEYLLLQET